MGNCNRATRCGDPVAPYVAHHSCIELSLQAQVKKAHSSVTPRNLGAEMPLGDRKKTERDLSLARHGEGEDISLSHYISLLPLNEADVQAPNSKHMDRSRDAQSNQQSQAGMSSSWSTAKVLLGIASSHGVRKAKQRWNNMGYLETRSWEQKWGLCTVLWQIHVQGHSHNKRTSYIRLETCKGSHIPTHCNTELSDNLHGAGSISFPRV